MAGEEGRDLTLINMLAEVYIFKEDWRSGLALITAAFNDLPPDQPLPPDLQVACSGSPAPLGRLSLDPPSSPFQ